MDEHYTPSAHFPSPSSPEIQTDPVASTELPASDTADAYYPYSRDPSPDTLEAELADGWMDLQMSPTELTPSDLPAHASYPMRTPIWDHNYELTGLAGWKKLSPTELTRSDIHPSQLGRSRLESGPYKEAADQCSWVLPAPEDAHPLSLLLAQLARPKFCSSMRWIESKEDNIYRLYLSQLTRIKLFSSEDGSVLGPIGSLDLHALRKLSTASPFGLGSQTVYDDSVRRGREVTAAQLHVGLAQILDSSEFTKRDGAWYFNDVAFHVGRYLFPEARSLKLVLYKLAMYTPGGHFKMHKDTTHADSHVGTLLIGCGVAQDEEPGSEEWEPVGNDFTEPQKYGYTGGDLVILNDFGQQQRYHIRPGQVLAFCTDVTHAVDVVTSGVKATLQFDIYIEDDSIPRDNTVACVDLTQWKDFYRPIYRNDVEDISQGDTSSLEKKAVPPVPPAPCPSCSHPNCVVIAKECHDAIRAGSEDFEEPTWFNQPEDYRRPYGGGSKVAWLGHWRRDEIQLGRYPRQTFAENVDRFVRHLVALLRDPSVKGGTVAFLLSHLYRKRSIRPKYLKST